MSRVLTEPQQRMLDEVNEAGEKRYNGRARRTVAALQNLGLVEVEYDLVPHMYGRYTELFIVRRKEEA